MIIASTLGLIGVACAVVIFIAAIIIIVFS
jgi:hypothetical protein